MRDPSQPQYLANLASPPVTGSAPAPHYQNPAEIVNALEKRLQQLQSAFDEHQLSLTNESKEIKQSQGDIPALKKVADAFTTACNEAHKATHAADEALVMVQDDIDSLPQGEREKIDAEMSRIDQDIDTKKGEFSTVQDQLPDLREAAERFAEGIHEQQAILAEERDWFSRLNEDVGALVSQLKRNTSDMKSAADMGQIRKVYVLSKDVATLREQIKARLDGAKIKEHTDTYAAAQAELEDLRAKETDNRIELEARETRVDALSKTVKDAQAARKEKLKALFVAPKASA